jgi:hypothetical protein
VLGRVTRALACGKTWSWPRGLNHTQARAIAVDVGVAEAAGVGGDLKEDQPAVVGGAQPRPDNTHRGVTRRANLHEPGEHTCVCVWE